MLVMSRKNGQRIVFPHLGVAVNILAIKGNIVKVGIDAPRDIKVLRDELVEADQSSSAGGQEVAKLSEHEIRNRLNQLSLKIALLQSKIDRGVCIDAGTDLQQLLSQLDQIDRHGDFDGSPAQPAGGRQIRVLVVEDSDNERNLLAYVLAAKGYDVHLACDGVEALKILQAAQRPFDVVLMDMNMPNRNGLQTLQMIRHDNRLADLKVFAVTGSLRDDNEEPIGRGWDGWFAKPVEVDTLLREIHERLGETSLAS